MKLFKVTGDNGQLPMFVFARGQVHACYEDWAKVAAVLGDGDDGEGDREGSFIDRRRLKAPKGLGGDEDAAPRYRWSVRDTFSYAGFAAP